MVYKYTISRKERWNHKISKCLHNKNEVLCMKYLWQIVRKLQDKDELDEEERRDLIDYLNVLKEGLQKLKIILYMDYVGYIGDFNVIFKEPWYCSEVR